MYQYANAFAENGHDVYLYHVATIENVSYNIPHWLRWLRTKILYGDSKPSWFRIDDRIKTINIPFIKDCNIRKADFNFITMWAEVLEIAKSMYQPDIFLGDLIQEGNLGLVLGLDMLTDVRTARETLRQQIRQSIQALIEEYMDSDSRNKKMVEQVKFLDESITKLTEELGRKVTIDELSVYMGMTEEEINDILRLTGEDPEESQEATEEEK